MTDGRMIGMKDMCPENVQKTLIRHAKRGVLVIKDKNTVLRSSKKAYGFEPVKAIMKRKVNNRCTASHSCASQVISVERGRQND